MSYSRKYDNFTFKAFWSVKVNNLVKKLLETKSKSHATHHEIVLTFINKRLFEGKGLFDKSKRKKGSTHIDLRIPSENGEKEYNSVEFKLRTSELEYLYDELWEGNKVFSRNDFLLFSYFLRRRWKEITKILKTPSCIYYLIVIIFPKKVKSIELKELLNEVKTEAIKFTKEVAEISGVDRKKEELIGVENMIKVEDLERQIAEQKDLLTEQKELLAKKEKEIEQLKKKLYK